MRRAVAGSLLAEDLLTPNVGMSAVLS